MQMQDQVYEAAIKSVDSMGNRLTRACKYWGASVQFVVNFCVISYEDVIFLYRYNSFGWHKSFMLFSNI